MRINGSPMLARPTVARAQAPAAPQLRPQVRTADGPPPEYSLWAILKDVGARIGNFFRNMF